MYASMQTPGNTSVFSHNGQCIEYTLGVLVFIQTCLLLGEDGRCVTGSAYHRTKFKYKFKYFNSSERCSVAAGEQSLSNTGEEDAENKVTPGN